MEWSNFSLKDLREKAHGATIEDKKMIMLSLQGDGRKGAANIVKALQKDVEDYERETIRIQKMKEFEYKYIEKGAKFVAGIDEVGRGPLAGPVYACAVIFPVDCIIRGVDDSKKLTPLKRKQLYEEIKKHAICYGIGCCDEKTIDEINILNATYEAMKMALSKLKVKPHVLLVDGFRIPGIDIFQVPIIKGDAKCFSIAASSIVAKVERDSIMDRYHEEYPQYNFISNKGYGTSEHIEAIKKYGPCPIHRKSYLKSII